jgi:Carboxypeptidase regulatory-like domain
VLADRQNTPQQAADGAVVGQVIEGGSGRPIAGAVVALSGPRGATRADLRKVLTDARGRFVFVNLPDGSFTLTATKAGYLPGELGRRDPLGPGQTLVLSAGKVLQRQQISLWKYAAVTGRVTDRNGQSLVGIRVEAWERRFVAGRPQFNNVIPHASRTDDRGVFRIAALAPGSYAFVVPAETLTLPVSIADRLEVDRSAEPDVAVMWRRAEVSVESLAKTKVAGTLGASIGPEPPGGQEGALVYPTYCYPDGHGPEEARPITVRAGEQLDGIDFTLQPVAAHVISGAISASGVAASHVALRLVRASAQPWTATSQDAALTFSDHDGTFTLLGVPDGAYELQVLQVPESGRPTLVRSASAPDAPSAIVIPVSPWSDRPTWWARVPIRVDGRDLHGVQVRLAEGYRMSGRLSFDGALAVSDAGTVHLDVETADGTALAPTLFDAVAVKADGTFRTIGLPPGSYFIRARSTPPGWSLKAVHLAGRDISVDPVDLQRDDVGIVVELTDRPTVLSGMVRRPDGQVAADAAVVVVPVDRRRWTDFGRAPRNIRLIPVAADGTYSVTGLPMGDYYVAAFVDVPRSAWPGSDLLERVAAEGVRVDVGEQPALAQNLLVRDRP